jgi:hypothetical protein
VITKESLRVVLSLLIVSGFAAFAGPGVAYAEFTEDYGHAGVLKTFKGQVRISDDSPIPGATLTITRLRNGQDYSIETDEYGNFRKADLPSGKYKIVVSSTSTNIGEFTVSISQGSPNTSSKYIIVKLSPGCASGDSGLQLVSKIN